MEINNEPQPIESEPTEISHRAKISRRVIYFFLPIAFAILLILSRPSENNVRISKNGVSVPLKYFTLIRLGKTYGAIRLTDYRVQGQKSSPIGVSSFVQNINADYESYYQGDGTGNFMMYNVIRYKSDSPNSINYAKKPVALGKSWVYCGPLKIGWTSHSKRINYLDLIAMRNNQRDSEEDISSYEIAATKWTDIAQVNVFDSRIKWVKPYELKDNQEIIIPINKLWDGK
jgi:hypothetical protein